MNTLGNKDITYSHLARFEDGRHSNLRELAKRALDGMRVMLLATTINLSTLFYMSGKEQEWMCFMFCTLDGAIFALASLRTEAILILIKSRLEFLLYTT